MKQLQAEGLVKAARLAPKGRRGGRARIYYDLTAQGLAVSARERRILVALVSPPHASPATPKERARMAERLLEAEELSEFGAELAAAAR